MSFKARVSYTADGNTSTFAITFSFIDSTHVKVFLDGVSTTAFSITGSNVVMNSNPSNGVVVLIKRETPTDSRLVDFQDGSVLTESDLDKSADQNFFIAQEVADDSQSKLGLDSSDRFDALNKRIINLADPTAGQDAVTKNYLENTFLTPANKTALTTVNANIANINAVNSNSANINSVNSNSANINLVAGSIGSVNTVATDIAKVITVANDLAEAVSEVETVADDLNETTSEIDTVATNIVNVNQVGNSISNVNLLAPKVTELGLLGTSAVVTDLGILGTSANVTAMGHLGTSANVTAMGLLGTSAVVTDMGLLGTSANVTAMGLLGTSANVTAMGLLGTSAVVTDLGILGTTANVNAMGVLGTSSNVTAMGVLGTSSNVTAMGHLGTSSNVTAMSTLGTSTNVSNMSTLAGITNLNNLANAHASVTSVANNLASVNSFANTYLGASGSAPTQDPDGSALDLGDLYFDTGSNQLKVYSSTGWVNAGSSVNGTSDRFKYTISGTPTTVSGNDDASNSLSYDAGFIDVFLNGIKMVNGTDVTVTSGNSVVFASALTNGDVVDIITFGTFNIANMNASNLTSGTVPSARISGAYTGITQTGTLTSFASTGIDDNATSTAITIDASENVLINTTDTDPTGNNTKGFVFQKDNEAKFSEDGLVLDLNRIGSDGGIIHVRKDGTVVGTIGAKSSNVFISSNTSNNTGFKINPDAITPSTSTGTDRDNAIDLGASSSRYKDLYLGGKAYVGSDVVISNNNALIINDTSSAKEILKVDNFNQTILKNANDSRDIIVRNASDADIVRFRPNGGIAIGGSGDANTLDDYEEGTWTPTFANSMTGTINAQEGKYIKIGHYVWIQARFHWSSASNLTNELEGLPFTVVNAGGEAAYSMNFVPYVNSGFGSIPSNYNYIIGYASRNSTKIVWRFQPNSGGIATFQASGNIYFAGGYISA